MIDSLTAEQELALVNYREECLRIGRCCDPADRALAESVIGSMYVVLGKARPKFWWCDGPAVGSIVREILGANLGANLGEDLWANIRENIRENLWANIWENLGENRWENLGDNLGENLWENLRENLRANLWENIGENLRENLRANLGENLGGNFLENLGENLRANLGDNIRENIYWPFWGQHEIHWSAFYSWPDRHLCTMHTEQERLRLTLWTDAARSCGWWCPFSGICFVCERPSKQIVDDRGLLHNDSGAAIVCRDGWQVFAIRNILVDEQIVMRPETQTIQQINSEKNADVQSIRIQRFGWPRYLKESKAKCLDECKNDVEGTQEALYVSPGGERRLVATCPTGRVFAMGVPAEIMNCEQARNWLQPKPFNILART